MIRLMFMRSNLFYPMKAEIEVCVDTLEAALQAQANGATRIELCGRLDLDGGVDGGNELHEIKEKSGEHIGYVLIGDLSIPEEDTYRPPESIGIDDQ